MRKELSKTIERICNTSKVRNDPKRVIDDLMQMGFNLISQGSLNAFTGCYQGLQCSQDYVLELADYKRDLKAWELLQHAFLCYMNEVGSNEPFADVIGLQYDEYLGKALGQFLTPEDVAEGAFQFSAFDSVSKHLEAQEHFNINDICSGAGALLLGALRVIVREHGKEALRYIHLQGNDLDPNMCRMCAVQLLLPSFMHNMAIGSITLTQGDTIVDYEDGFDPVLLAVRNVFDYDNYMTKHMPLEAKLNHYKQRQAAAF